MSEIDDHEQRLLLVASELGAVQRNECLFCYLDRMLSAFGCTGGHRFSERWRDAQPRKMPALIRWLQANGGCCCDCEVVMNVFREGRESRRHLRLRCLASYAEPPGSAEEGD